MIKRGNLFVIIGLLFLTAALSIVVYNIRTSAEAAKSAENVLSQLEEVIDRKEPSGDTDTAEDSIVPDYILNPEMNMPEKEIDGMKYIGTLSLPSLDLELPINSEWSYPGLKISPCRYSGSVYLNNMVIAAHNYTRHFGNIKNLAIGGRVIFTDMNGNRFFYTVADIEILSPYAVEEMTSGEWDLSLFTCTVGGQARVTVRCKTADSAY